ncbi:MAG: hypothetical protein JW940_16195 [Polyangiaceae bacterium]|nr:hypothetical protein [Polyangiaceae bacterium]
MLCCAVRSRWLGTVLLVVAACSEPRKSPGRAEDRPERAAWFAYQRELREAGDQGHCDQAQERVRKAMAADARLTDRDLQTEIARFEKVRGAMPYPSPGTACSLFGLQSAARGALDDRKAARR